MSEIEFESRETMIGARVQTTSMAVLGNFHMHFYEAFAEWLYDNDPTPAHILNSLRAVIYLSSVDGLSLFEAVQEVIGRHGDELHESKWEQEIKKKRKQILSFAKENPDLSHELGDEMLRLIGAGEMMDSKGKLFPEGSWDWYTYHVKERHRG